MSKDGWNGKCMKDVLSPVCPRLRTGTETRVHKWTNPEAPHYSTVVKANWHPKLNILRQLSLIIHPKASIFQTTLNIFISLPLFYSTNDWSKTLDRTGKFSATEQWEFQFLVTLSKYLSRFMNTLFSLPARPPSVRSHYRLIRSLLCGAGWTWLILCLCHLLSI